MAVANDEQTDHSPLPSWTRRDLSPPWLLAIEWTAMIAVTVVLAHGTVHKIGGGVAMLVAAVAVQFTGEQRPPRFRPAGVLVATVAALATILIAPQGLGYVPVYVAARNMPFAFRRSAQQAFVVVDSVVVGLVVAFATGSVPGLLAGFGVPILVQRSVERRALIRERDRAEALLAEVQAGQDAEARNAALRERGRIAREMHDVLAHSLAGLSLQVQAARAVAIKEKAPDTVLDPITKAAELARTGLAEARAAVGALRDPGGLGLDALPALIERHPGTTALDIVGEPRPVHPDTGHAVYRAVQESLTNAARYAPGSRVRVELRWGADELTVHVDDDGPAAGHSAVAGQGTGLGLAGMDERLREVGGGTHAGPRPGGGWRVAITVPVEESR